MKSTASTTATSHGDFLQRFRSFTDKTRKAAYIDALQLPLNYHHFTQLSKRVVQLLPEHTLDKQTTEIVNALCAGYPNLKVQWLPGIVYPFVRLFPKDSLAQFQIALTFLANWCAPLFHDYPSPAKELIRTVGERLPELQNAVKDIGSSLGGLIWPMFLVSFTDVLNKKDWLQIFDYAMTKPYQPWLLLCIIIELLRYLEPQLLPLKSLERMHCLLRKERKLDVRALIRYGTELAVNYQQSFAALYTEAVFPLPKGRYPLIQFVSKESQIRVQISTHQQEATRKLQQQVDQLEQQLRRRNVELQKLTEQHRKNYSEKLELALRNHLKTVSETNHRKLEALRQVESQLRERIASNENYRREQSSTKWLIVDTMSDYVKRRALLQRAINQAKQQTEAVRQMEMNAMHNLKQVVRHKEEEQRLIQKNLHQSLHPRKS